MSAAAGDVSRLLTIMERLRDPERGCPWDLRQTFASIAPYTIEEAYEVADAIDRGDLPALRDELGDLLLQVVFHARLAQEAGAFGFADVVASISGKMERRHPHIFGPDASAGASSPSWEAIKRGEREARGDSDTSALAGIGRGIPEWQRAVKLQARAAQTGFDWPDPAQVLAKLQEEAEEVRAEFAASEATPGDPAAAARLEEEIGDLLFVAANLARHAGVDVGSALRRANSKFERRFRAMEQLAQAEGQEFAAQPLPVQERYWQRVKQAE